MLIDNLSGSVFYIYKRSGNTVKAQLQNNYVITGGVVNYQVPIHVSASTTEVFFIVNTRIYLPGMYSEATFTSGSNTILIAESDGDGSGVATEFPVGNAILTDPKTFNIYNYSGNNNIITSVTAGSATTTTPVAAAVAGTVVTNGTANKTGLYRIKAAIWKGPVSVATP